MDGNAASIASPDGIRGLAGLRRLSVRTADRPHRMIDTGMARLAKYYQLTPAGRRQLAVEAGEWERMSTAIGRVMKLA